MDFNAHGILVFTFHIGYGIGGNGPVFEFDAVGDFLHVGHRHRFVEGHLVDFFHFVAGMGESLRELPVVGEQDESCGVFIESSHRIDPFLTGLFDQVHNGAFGMGIVGGGHHLAGFVEQNIDFPFGSEKAVVEADLVGRGNLGSQFGDHLSVDGDHTRGNVFVGFTAGADSGVGNEPVEPDEFFLSGGAEGFFSFGGMAEFPQELPAGMAFLSPENQLFVAFIAGKAGCADGAACSSSFITQGAPAGRCGNSLVLSTPCGPRISCHSP